jgi:hypothetical protein
MSPTTELLVQVELPTTGALLAVASLDITQPVRSNVDQCCDAPNRYATGHEDEPDVTGIEQLSQLPYKTWVEGE